MFSNNLEKFINFLASDTKRQDKVKSIGWDFDALAEYARGLGYDVSPQELREYREKALELMENKLRKAQQAQAAQSPGVRAFYALLRLAETDKEIEKRLEEICTGTKAELIAYGKEKGFIFSEQDLDDVGKDVLEPSDELSEEELELVAGGTTLGYVALIFFLAVAGLAVIGTAFIVGFISTK